MSKPHSPLNVLLCSYDVRLQTFEKYFHTPCHYARAQNSTHILKSLFTYFLSAAIRFLLKHKCKYARKCNFVHLDKDNDQKKISHEQIDCHGISLLLFSPTISKTDWSKSVKRQRAHSILSKCTCPKCPSKFKVSNKLILEIIFTTAK